MCGVFLWFGEVISLWLHPVACDPASWTWFVWQMCAPVKHREPLPREKQTKTNHDCSILGVFLWNLKGWDVKTSISDFILCAVCGVWHGIHLRLHGLIPFVACGLSPVEYMGCCIDRLLPPPPKAPPCWRLELGWPCSVTAAHRPSQGSLVHDNPCRVSDWKHWPLARLWEQAAWPLLPAHTCGTAYKRIHAATRYAHMTHTACSWETLRIQRGVFPVYCCPTILDSTDSGLIKPLCGTDSQPGPHSQPRWDGHWNGWSTLCGHHYLCMLWN